MEEYTLEEINFFVSACLRREEQELQKAALANRAAQADKEGWKEFLRATSRNIDRVGAHGAKKGTVRNLNEFHSRILNLPSMSQIRDARKKARAAGKEPDDVAAMTQASSVRVMKGLRRPPEPVLPKELRRIPPTIR